MSRREIMMLLNGGIQEENLPEYECGYAPVTNHRHAKCRECGKEINGGEVRIAKLDYSRHYTLKLWHHINCFAENREELGFLESAIEIPGFWSLEREGREELMSALPPMDSDESEGSENEDEEDEQSEEEEEVINLASDDDDSEEEKEEPPSKKVKTSVKPGEGKKKVGK
ncbi:poly [ADP-ribose] polymerase-like [Neocloeon triangulifer]|uniref:poly [ADP-ribose] polymerase-like n=1 Tax=Neocloeon triangulifer TaxID=2078957 RepID=UPI00286EFA15|nr:poly [ADP-ribose] polymerase-like [Neocloeon triangulifer]